MKPKLTILVPASSDPSDVASKQAAIFAAAQGLTAEELLVPLIDLLEEIGRGSPASDMGRARFHISQGLMQLDNFLYSRRLADEQPSLDSQI